MMTGSASTPVFQPISVELTPGDTQHDNSSDIQWHLRDNSQMQALINQYKRKAKLHQFSSALDTSLAVAASFLSAQAGTAPTHFPVFSSHFGGTLDTPESILINQDKINSKTLSEFVSLFIQSSHSSRPKIKFEYQNRDKALALFSKVSGMVNLYQNFKKQTRPVLVTDGISENDEIISFAMSGNHLPSLGRYMGGDQSILLGWAAAKSSKLHDTRSSSEYIIRKTLGKITAEIQSSSKNNLVFWHTLYVQLLLDLALVTDGAPAEIQQAITISRQLKNPAFIAHSQRFCNQTLGVSKEALATLSDSVNRFNEIPRNSDEYQIFASSRLGAMLNRNTTAFVASTDVIDTGSLEADYWEAKETSPSYSCLGMLASTAAIGCMIKGHNRRAVELLEHASLERSLPIDNFNIRANLLCAQYLHSAKYEENTYVALCRDIAQYSFLPAWEYHKIRICLNLMKISNGRDQYDLAWNIISKSHFWDGIGDTNEHSELHHFLVAKRYSHYLVGSQIGGRFGNFVEKTQLFPAIDKDWT